MRIHGFVLASVFAVLPTLAQAGVYVSETFQDATAPGWTFNKAGSDPGPYLTADAAHQLDKPGDGWLRLTGSGTNQSNSVFYDNAVSLKPGQGLSVQFDFAVYGGSGADGLTFSLMDGSVATPKAGGYGGSLGYANRGGINGLTGGYLGVGLDEFGNFSNPNEGRNGGPGYTPNAIAVRGAGNGQKGYAYLTGTKNEGANFLDYRNQKTRPDQTSSQFRRLYLTLFEKSQTELLLTVAIQSGFGKDPITYINEFNVIGTFGGATQPGLPSSIKFGFTGGTGSATDIHEIRNFKLGTYDLSPIASHATPEPSTMISAAIAGLVGLGIRLRRTQKKARCQS